jgi:multiple sugar transport system substrate-binding protein
MPQELEFSIMGESHVNIQPLLDQFEAEHDIHVHLNVLSWDSAWSQLVKVALYGDGPDVSEIGSTWVGDLAGMNALRPFDAREIVTLGGASSFLPSAWQGGTLAGEEQQWTIPWLLGARLLYYRRDLIQQAGIDERTAFQSIEQLEQTVNRLHAKGVAVPWTVPTNTTHTTLLNVASWVWGAGGEFVSADGRQVLFDELLARTGLRAYFALGKYLATPVRHLKGLEPDEQFLSSAETAITVSGPWLFLAARERMTSEALAQLGVVLPPGAPFVGGSHLVIWKHTHKADAALKLVHLLTQPFAQVTWSREVGLLPARLDALSAPPFSTDPVWQIAAKGLTTGRTFPTTRSWGLCEGKLVTELGAMWAEVLVDPDADLDAMVLKHIAPLARRLRLALEQK